MGVGIVGLGNLGTAIGNLVASNGYRVVGWEYNASVVDQINREHINTRFLPGIQLNANLTATSALGDVFRASETVFIALPSVFIGPTLEPVAQQARGETTIVNLAKGIDGRTGLTSFQMLSALFPNNKKVMLSGPSIANEFAQGMPTVV